MYAWIYLFTAGMGIYTVCFPYLYFFNITEILMTMLGTWLPQRDTILHSLQPLDGLVTGVNRDNVNICIGP